MHPIFRDRNHLGWYLSGWVALGVLLAGVLAAPGFEDLKSALLLAVPLCVLYGFVCLAVWYPCRATPVADGGVWRLLLVHGTGSVISSSLWLSLGWLWSAALDRSDPGLAAGVALRRHAVVFFALGILLYLLAVAVHYLLLAFAATRQAERRALGLKLLAQEAKLEALKAQIDPHFLFNCLNSISSLCGRDPEAARQTAIRLGDFLRTSLKHGAKETITLGEELKLARDYLAVEQARFGERLKVREEIDDEVLARRVPALLLQPLLENALKHGIAHLLEGGRVELEARAETGRVHLRVANPCAADRPRGTGEGIGIANVRGRLRLLYADEAVLAVRDLGETFEVEIVLPPSTPTAFAERPRREGVRA